MSRTEEILRATIDGDEYTKTPQSREEELLLELKQTIEGGGGTSVVPNPEGEATETLTKLGVNDTVYGIPSGGGGGTQYYAFTESSDVGTLSGDAKISDIRADIEAGKSVYLIQYINSSPTHVFALSRYTNDSMTFVNILYFSTNIQIRFMTPKSFSNTKFDIVTKEVTAN